MSLPTVRTMRRHIAATLDAATPAELAAGAAWYDEAHELAAELGARYDLTTTAAAGILAALSPCTSWPRNVHLAHLLAGTGDAPHRHGLAIARARAIRNGADPLDILGGRKVRAFFQLLADPSDPDVVVVDRHALSAALGRRIADGAPERRRLETASGYAAAADAYRAAAASRGMARTHEAQGAAWITWRRIHLPHLTTGALA